MSGGAMGSGLTAKTNHFLFEQIQETEEEPQADEERQKNAFLKRGEKSRRGYDPQTAIQQHRERRHQSQVNDKAKEIYET